jgi:hypothetical protein
MIDYRQLVELGLSPDVETLTERSVRAAEAMGFGLCSGLLIRGRLGSQNAAMKAFGNTPAGFLEHSKSLDEGLRDPVLTSLLAKPGHVTYNEALYFEAGVSDLWDCQAQFGYRSGLSCSSHHPNVAEVFFFGVDGPDGLPTSTTRLLELQATLQMITLHAGSALNRIVGMPAPKELAPSERKALQVAGATMYTQRGSFVVIERVQDPVLRQAVQKLGARNVTEAVLRAIDGGLIQR